jgi:hypothetical protein
VEFLALAGFALVLGAVLTAFAASWWSDARGLTHLERAWESYARRRGVAFAPPSGEWPTRSPPILYWEEGDGVRYRIEARGREAVTRTILVARPALAVFGELVVRRPIVAAADDMGWAPLDGRLVVRARPAQFAERVLTQDVKRALCGFDLGGDLSLVYAKGDVVLGWSGGEANEARLDEAREVVRRVVEALGGAYSTTDPPDPSPWPALLPARRGAPSPPRRG